MKLRIDADSLMKDLDRLGQELIEKGTRPAAQAGAQVFYDTVRARAPVSRKAHKSGWKKKGWEPTLIEPGALRAAVYQVFSQRQSSNAHAVYEISVNQKKAPHWLVVEFGKNAHPFLRPSFYAAEDAAQRAMVEKFVENAKGVKGISVA